MPESNYDKAFQRSHHNLEKHRFLLFRAHKFKLLRIRNTSKIKIIISSFEFKLDFKNLFNY